MGFLSKKKKEKKDDFVASNQPVDIAEEKIQAVEKYLKKERDRNFNKGLITGAIAFGVAILVTTLIGWFPPADGDAKLKALEHIVDENYLFDDKVDEDAADEATYKGYINSLGDPYSEYMTKKEFKAFNDDLSGELLGVGIVYTLDNSEEGAPAKIVEVMEGYSADRNGIQPNDVILSIDGQSVANLEMEQIAARMKGKEGTKVKVELYRESTDKKFTVELTREKIKATTVHDELLADGSGYIRIRQFDRDTDEEFEKAVDHLMDQNVKGIIIDLRGNTGGLLDSTTEMLDYLLPKGKLVTTKYKDGTEDVVNADNKHQVDLPMAILINGMSASASEMFTGAMQDYEKAVVVGTQSFGKGIVQNVYRLKDGSAVKITIAEYLTPKNRHIHKKGITPDIKVEDTRESIIDENDAQLREAQKAIAEWK